MFFDTYHKMRSYGAYWAGPRIKCVGIVPIIMDMENEGKQLDCNFQYVITSEKRSLRTTNNLDLKLSADGCYSYKTCRALY